MVFEQEVGAFELASLELAGGLYANDTDFACIGAVTMTATIATVRQGTVSTYGISTLTLNGQMAGKVQADMNCAGSATANPLAQAISAAVTSSSGQAITSFGLHAYGAMVAQSVSLSSADYVAGSYATTRQSVQSSASGHFGGQSTSLTSVSALAGSAVQPIGQTVNLSSCSMAASATNTLLAQAYGDQRLSANSAATVSAYGARVYESTNHVSGTALMAAHGGAYAMTAISDPVGAYELADFELGMSEIGGELLRYGAAHADMLCVGQSIALSRVAVAAGSTDHICSSYVLPSGFAADAGSDSNLLFSAYRSMHLSVSAESTATITVPNARLFSWLAKSYDMAQRAYETRGTIRPWEMRGVKRPYEPRDNSVNAQQRMTNWS